MTGLEVTVTDGTGTKAFHPSDVDMAGLDLGFAVLQVRTIKVNFMPS